MREPRTGPRDQGHASLLPAFYPDLDPIDVKWGKARALLREADARTHPELLQALILALRATTKMPPPDLPTAALSLSRSAINVGPGIAKNDSGPGLSTICPLTPIMRPN